MRIGVNCFLLQADHVNNYIFFHFRHNIEELSALESDRWIDDAMLLSDQLEVLEHLDSIDLYFCPFGALWPRPLPVPTVVMLDDIQEVFYPEFFSIADQIRRAYHYGGSTRMADRVITISNFSKMTIVKKHRIPADKVAVAHLCAGKQFHQAVEVARPPKATFPQGDFIFYPANRWKHKNHDILLQALVLLKRKAGLIINAVFTGFDTSGGYPLHQKAVEYGLKDQVYELGCLSLEEIAYLYLNAKMLVYPSFFEGFGIPLVEAMSTGCPVAAANSSSLPEIGAGAVSYFNPKSPNSIAETIEAIWRSDSLRQSLIEKGRFRARQFSDRKLAQAHQTVFKEAMQSFATFRYYWNSVVYRHIHWYKIYLKYRKVLRRGEEIF